MNKTKRFLVGLGIFLFCLLVLAVLGISQWTHWPGVWSTVGEFIAIGSGIMLMSTLTFFCQILWHVVKARNTSEER